LFQVINSQLQVRYDLGSGDRSLVLSGVNVSDGEQHLVRVDRHGNQVVLQLDAGEGPLYTEQWPLDEHRLFRLSAASGGGQVIQNVWTKAVTVQSISNSKRIDIIW
jgi:Laminin G domain